MTDPTPRDRLKGLVKDVEAVLSQGEDARAEAKWLRQVVVALLAHCAPGARRVSDGGRDALYRVAHPHPKIDEVLRYAYPDHSRALGEALGLVKEEEQS